jgi:hypothetical protein
MAAAQFAVTVHLPVPASMVMIALALAGEPVTLPAEQTPDVLVMVGMTGAFVVAVTINVAP